MTTINDGGQAFPFGQTDNQTGQLVNGWGSEGMSIRQYAAIRLYVPNSGMEWLDDMIRERLRNDFAAKVMHAVIGQAHRSGNCIKDENDISSLSYQMADAMLAEMEHKT